MVKKRKAFTGAQCTAEAMRQINPDVVAAYPITPQTNIMHAFSQFVADGDVDTEFITVESEHSAMSACVGSSAAGARTMTATSANGLALMWEIVYIAASTRLPIVMNIVNRALSGPINIHCDHSDSMGCRDSGWIQIYSENGEEAYENTIMAMRIAEHTDVLLPVMVCQDGFITSHCVETVELLDDETVKNFIGEYVGHYPLLDVDKPVTYGPLDLFDYYFEHKRQQVDAMQNSVKVIREVFDEFGKITGKHYDFFEGYRLEDAEKVIVCANSSAGTIRVVIDELREQGQKVGLLKMRVFRPWLNDMVVEKLRGVKAVAVLDRSDSFGAFGGPLFSEIRSSFHEETEKPNIIDYIYGLGGRELDIAQIKKVFAELEEVKTNVGERVRYLGVRE
ncbi:MAG: pyruvate ferredoxin oxidoreductase [Nanoarchaeota archaeon]|nr:pyruvate ferredoxin oxidoreductase [Nanoarchaeota archaeon]MBU1322317.1 pyruvate ferredoxin oxidoreductase [Nanoarchaeota archaeon]MBU1597856.1 pyruvate ferredoxin oxidoreductase [Nanoarchaeota archaeon]MBU2441443.1 pyruvate ferredoxin oxidoreductase [Nanoarchaeota archaeon]